MISSRDPRSNKTTNDVNNTLTLEEEQNLQSQPSVRNILGFIEKYDRVECQELLSQMSCHWLLSLEDYKIPIEHPTGLITQMPPLNEDNLYVLFEYDPTVPELDYREIHQIIRELTIGIYVLNQHPYLQLEANIDESTSCQLPPAYFDTKLGQIMINTDYWLKALWHGAFFPREKRIKFCERWRTMLDIDSNGQPQTKKPLLTEFRNSGMQDISKDPDYSCIFNDNSSQSSKSANSANLAAFGVGMTGNTYIESTSPYSDLSNDLNLTEEQIKEKLEFFFSNVDNFVIQMTFGLNNINSFKNMYKINGSFELNSLCKADLVNIDGHKYELIRPILDAHEKFLREHFDKKPEIKKNIAYLKIVSFLVPLLIGLKKRMKIPNMNNLLPLMTGEEVRTERELPPLILSSDFKSKLFANFSPDKYFNLHGGIQFELESCSLNKDNDNEFQNDFNKITEQVTALLDSYLSAEQQQKYPIPIVEVGPNKKQYYCIKIDFEGYYSTFPQKPYWISKLTDDLLKLKPKRLPMTEIQIYDLFKKLFGYKRATKNKNMQIGLREAARRGLINIFSTFIRKTPANRLSKHDEFGLGLMHYAAIYNKPLIISSLIMLAIDLNIKQQIDFMAIGPMPLHYAARCGSLDSLSCLLANYASISFSDHEGMCPIHHACFFDNVPIVKLMLRKQPELLEVATKSESRKTPILVAASAGSLETVKCLIEFGANLSYQDDNGYNMIHIAAQKSHTNILKYFIQNSYRQLPIWTLLVNMLSNERDQEASVKCLQLLTHRNKEYWKSIVDAGGVDKLFDIVRKYASSLLPQTTTVKPKTTNLVQQLSMNKQQSKNVQITTLNPVTREAITLDSISVLCNLSDHDEVKQVIGNITDLSSVLMTLLEHCNNKDIISRVAILIADVGIANDVNKSLFADGGCLAKLMSLLNSDVEDLLVNCVNAIEIMCINNSSNQNFCCNNGIVETFISLLNLNSDLLKSSVAAAISALTHSNNQNQMISLKKGLIKPVVDLLKSRNMTVQLKACQAIESLAINNQQTQDEILKLEAESYMIKLLEDRTTYEAIFEFRKTSNDEKITLNLEYNNLEHHKVMTLEFKQFVSVERMYYVGATIKTNMDDWSIIVREQAANTLWTLAGSLKPQRIMIAEKIGISQIISMIMSRSEKLQYVGCKCVISLVFENLKYQNIILKENCVDHLIRLLKFDKISSRVTLACIETIGALCVDIAHVNNTLAQSILMDKGAIEILTNIIENTDEEEVQIEAAHTYACLVLNKQNDDFETNLDIDVNLLLNLIKTDDLELRLKAGLAITVLAYNNNDKQFDIKSAGGISFEYYKVYFNEFTSTPIQLCKACFQLVVLARVINDRDQVWLTALGINKLAKLLLFHDDEQVIIQTASYLSSLAHTRGGITDAMIACDVINILCDHLFSQNDQIRFTSAITLGYLTYNRTASRLLLHNCRNMTTLYDQLISSLRPDSKISSQFVDSYKTALKLGIPKLLVRNKIKFYDSNMTSNLNDNDDMLFNSFKTQFEENAPKLLFVNEEFLTQLKPKASFKNRSQSAPMIKHLRDQQSQLKLHNNNHQDDEYDDYTIINKIQKENTVVNIKTLKKRNEIKPLLENRPKTSFNKR